MGHSKLETSFEYYWMILAPANAPPYQREYAFHPDRNWRFDFAWAETYLMIAVECDGGRWQKGGGKHASADDYFKIAHAAAMGWLVLRFNGDNLRDDPQECIDLVLKALTFKMPTFVPEPSRVLK